jgi:hypothetical protein
MSDGARPDKYDRLIRPYHREFGIAWSDLFEGSGITVEVEVDLSLKQQFLDLIIIRRGNAAIPCPLPDGFGELAPHNLITLKSPWEALDGWALQELIGHYVNYRKQTSESGGMLNATGEYRLFAVAARFPRGLSRDVSLNEREEGVYDIEAAGLTIRVIVMNRLQRREHNAMLHLFAAKKELFEFGRRHYRPHSAFANSLLTRLLETYREDQDMNEMLKKYADETLDKIIAKQPLEKRLKGMSTEDRIEGISVQELVEALTPEKREALRRELEKGQAKE